MSVITRTPLTAMLKGILISYIITAAVFITYAVLMTYTDVSGEHISLAAIVTTAAACTISGFITARAAVSRGLVWGMLSGLLYVLILFISAFLLIPAFVPSAGFAVTILLAIAGGGLGGIFGINLKHSK